MRRKELEFHRNSKMINDRRYGESFVKYFLEPSDCSIRQSQIFVNVDEREILEIELVNNDYILSSLLNLGRKIYNEAIHKEIVNSQYLYNRKFKLNEHIEIANSFREFITYQMWLNPEIESIVKDWVNENPYYGNIQVSEELYCEPINIYSFVTLAVTFYMIYSIFRIASKHDIDDMKISNDISFMSIFSDIVRTSSQSYESYKAKLNSMRFKEIKDNCISVLSYILNQNHLTNYFLKIFADGSVGKVHTTLLSVATETLISKICCNSREISTCLNCGNFYVGHGNSYLCIPCRTYKDNHKHIKTDRN